MRCARPTTCPWAVNSMRRSSPIRPTTTSPELSPMRTANGMPCWARTSPARSGAWAGDGAVARPLIVSARAAAAAEFLADLDRGAAGGTPHGQFGAALCAEATVEPVVVVTGRTAHWVLGQLVVADRD